MIIPNLLPASAIILFPLAVLTIPEYFDVPLHLATGTAILGVGLVLHRLRVMGGGDIKLLVPLGLWAGPGYLPGVLLTVAFVGGVLAIVLILLRKASGKGQRAQRLPRVLLNGEKLPYGIAIAAGALYLAHSHPFFTAPA